jgi:general secretion pathway protein L
VPPETVRVAQGQDMLRDFFGWWSTQLTELIPRRLRRSAPSAADATVITLIDPAMSEIAVGLRRGGKETPLGRYRLGTGELADLPRSPGKPAVLRLGEADVLAKTLVLPLAAERELDQALLFEMDRETPFRPDELYWNHRVEAVDRQNARLSVRLVLAPKAELASLLEPLGHAGIGPVRAEIADGPDAGFWLPLNGNRHSVGRGRGLLLRPLAICCAVLAIAVIATPFMRQSITTTKLDHALAAGRAAAGEADKLHAEISRLAGSADLITKEREKVGQPLAVLAAATRVLPDDSYLTEMQLQQRKLTMSGRSGAAARLIGVMAADGEFHNPTFAAPVTRIEALRQEIFTIVTEVAP